MEKRERTVALQVILSIVNGRGSDRPVFDTTRQLTERFVAHADIALLRPDPGLAVPYMSEGMSGDIIERLISEAEALNVKRTKTARDEFQVWQEETKFLLAESRSDLLEVLKIDDSAPSCAWSEFTGSTNHLVSTMGRLADLIVLSHDISDQEMETAFTFETTLMESGRPLLLAPSVTRKTIGDNIAVAWDGSAEASRAVAAALPFLKTAQSVNIVSVTEKSKDRATTDGLAHYLSWHGIAANTRMVDAGDRSVGEAVLEIVTQESADLLVMGAYGHSRYREWIFGGVTRHILDECALPVLLVH